MSAKSFSMINNDDFEARILKLNEENILVLDRGIEDGVERGDHVKITNNFGFMARAIALRAGMLTSHWKIYRVTNPDKISKDITYKVTNINNHEVAEKYMDFKVEDTSSDHTDFNEAELLAWGKKEDDNSIATDLPKDMLGDPVLEVEPDFAARNFNSQQFEEDFKKWTARIAIPAYTFASIRKTEKSRTVITQINVTNVGKKYNLNLQIDRNETKTESITADYDDIDPSDGIATITQLTRNKIDHMSMMFSIYNIIPRLAATSNYDKRIAYLNSFKSTVTTNVSPLGIELTVVKGADEDSEPIWKIGLTPGYQKTSLFFQNAQYDYETGGTFTSKDTRSFSLNMSSEINFNIGSISVSNSSSWAPQISPDDPTSWSTAEANLTNELSISFPISTSVSGSFLHSYEYNFIPQFGPLQDQKQNQTFQLTFNYSLNL